MFHSDKIVLRKPLSTTQNANGYSETVYELKTVWANPTSIGRSEHYASQAQNINLAVNFEVHVEDYKGQTSLVYEGRVYEVHRTYQKGMGIVVLVCTDKGADNGTDEP